MAVVAAVAALLTASVRVIITKINKFDGRQTIMNCDPLSGGRVVKLSGKHCELITSECEEKIAINPKLNKC